MWGRVTLTGALAFAASVPLSGGASAENLIFMLDNQSSYAVVEFYASPYDVDVWEEDVLSGQILLPGEAMRITIADGRDQCEYDLRVVFEDGDAVEDAAVDLCETGSYTVND